MMLTDTHCHLDFEQFDSDRDEAIRRAEQAGLTRILVPGIDLASSRAAVALAERQEIVYAAVGVHPNYGTSWEPGTRQALAELTQHPKVVAIGEVGLDRYWDYTPLALQRKILREQLALAAETSLPVVIHNREAFDEVVPMLLAWQEDLVEEDHPLAENPGVLHSYSGNIMQAETVLNHGFYLGITGPVTFKNATEMQEVAQSVSEERLLIETDAPYLTPHPFRGKRNEPAHVRYVAEKIASLRGCPVEEVGAITSRNAKNLFDW